MRTFIRLSLTFWLLGLLGFLMAAAVAAVELEGSLALLNRKGTKPARGVDLRDAVIWWEPAEKKAIQPIEGGAEMAMIKKQFDPRVVIVTPGTAVHFPNGDPILHNVFSVSGDNGFDLGLYRKGPGKSYTFEEEGVVRVFCNVHHAMVGYVLVLGTPHRVRPGKDGRFVLSDLAEGEGDLVVWHERGEDPMRMKLTLPHEDEVELSLEMSRARVPTHLNKAGRNYARASDAY